MSKRNGCILILAGIAVAAYALYSQPPTGTKTASAQIAGKVAGDTAGTRSAPAASSAYATLPKPPLPAAAPVSQPASGAGTASGPEPRKSEPAASRVVPPPHLAPPAPVPAQRPRAGVVRVDETPPRVPVGDTASAAAPLDRVALTREIQRQLKRVGCYRGDVTGVWSPSVRQAMQALTERANASLPINEPDPVLLAMVQSQAPGACSATCPSGQDRASNGRCVPSALVASAAANAGVKANARKQHSGTASATAPRSVPAGAPTAAYRPAHGRMSLAGPPASATQQAKTAHRPQAAHRRAPRVAGWSRNAPQVRTRRAYRQPSYTTYSGLPSWFPF